MLSVSWVITISIFWMVLVVVLFRLFGKGKDSLGAFILCLMTMFFPVIIFVFTCIMCWINGVNETVYYVLMLILSSVFIGLPFLYLAGKYLYLRIRYTPKRAAAYARKKVGRFKHFHRGKWSAVKYYSEVHPNEEAYLGAQIFEMWMKLRDVYRIRPRFAKKRYIRRIMELNMPDLPQIRKWEFHTILNGLYKAETDVLLHFTDGEKGVVFLYWPKRRFTVDELTEEDQKKVAYVKKFWNITMTGRLIYLYLCIERYLVAMYPDRDWTPVARRMWNRTKNHGRWTEGSPGDLYREIVPERIMRFYKHGYGYEELNSMVFDRKLSLEDYTEIRKIYEGISRGDPKEEINQMVGMPERLFYHVDLNQHDSNYADQMTIELILKAEAILEKRQIEIPDFSQVERFSYQRRANHIREEEAVTAFGYGVEASELSIILSEKKETEQ